MLHHVELEPASAAMVRALRTGGTLLLLDVLDRRNLPLDAFAFAAKALRNLDHGRTRGEWRLRKAWACHGGDERHPTIEEACSTFSRLPPAASCPHIFCGATRCAGKKRLRTVPLRNRLIHSSYHAWK